MPPKFVPDTAKPVYNKLVRLPDLNGFTTTLNGPSVSAQPFITEFIARYEADADMSDTTTYVNTEVGYAPYSTLPVYNLDKEATDSFMNTVAS